MRINSLEVSPVGRCECSGLLARVKNPQQFCEGMIEDYAYCVSCGRLYGEFHPQLKGAAVLQTCTITKMSDVEYDLIMGKGYSKRQRSRWRLAKRRQRARARANR